jgi:hypothetical protein
VQQLHEAAIDAGESAGVRRSQELREGDQFVSVLGIIEPEFAMPTDTWSYPLPYTGIFYYYIPLHAFSQIWPLSAKDYLFISKRHLASTDELCVDPFLAHVFFFLKKTQLETIYVN